MFVEAGCGEHAFEQPLKRSKAPNLICVLPGESGRTIIVGAHFDRVSEGDGVADNWSGAALLPSLYQAINREPRQHTYIFIGFTDEELGLVGSRFYANRMTPAEIAATDAMVNIDTLGLGPTNVWVNRSDQRLTLALRYVGELLGMAINGVSFEQVGTTDSESFARKKIPRVTVHTLTQENHNAEILHTRKDRLSVIQLDDYYASYRLLAAYLVFLDTYLGTPEAPTAGEP